MTKSDAPKFGKELKIIRLFRDYDLAVEEFKKLYRKYLSKYPAFMGIPISKQKSFYILSNIPNLLENI